VKAILIHSASREVGASRTVSAPRDGAWRRRISRIANFRTVREGTLAPIVIDENLHQMF